MVMKKTAVDVNYDGGDDGDAAEDHSLLLGPTAAGADRMKIRSSLICDFEFWVSYDPDFTIFPGDFMYLLRMQAGANENDKKVVKSGSGFDDHSIGASSAWGNYTDLVKPSDRSDTESDVNDEKKDSKMSQRPRLSGIDATQHAKHDISGKILWYLTNQDNKENKHLNFRKLSESDRFWTLFMTFLFCILIIVIIIFYGISEYWWVVLVGALLWILILFLLNRRYKSGYNDYHNNRMFELMKLCNKMNQHSNGLYKDCFFELFQKESMSAYAWCSTRQYQRKAMIRVTPATYTIHNKKNRGKEDV